MAQESFKPWIGKHYDETGLLLLGESAYSWLDEDDRLRNPSPDLPTEMVNEVLDNFENADNMPFMKTLSRGLAGEREPSKERLHHVRHRVAFTNYVGGTVGEAPRECPARDMWGGGQARLPP